MSSDAFDKICSICHEINKQLSGYHPSYIVLKISSDFEKEIIINTSFYFTQTPWA